MRYLLALYDPAHTISGGNYWTWRHPEIPVRLLDKLYYDVAQPHLPEGPNKLSPEDIHGGFAGLDATWCCWYRVVDGGYDPRGRPGRFVILAAFAKRQQQQGPKGLDVLECLPFRGLTEKARTSCPVLPPDSLEIEIEHVPMEDCDQEQLKRVQNGESAKFTGDKAIRDALVVCAHVPPERPVACHILRQGTINHTTVLAKKPMNQIQTSSSAVTRPSPAPSRPQATKHPTTAPPPIKPKKPTASLPHREDRRETLRGYWRPALAFLALAVGIVIIGITIGRQATPQTASKPTVAPTPPTIYTRPTPIPQAASIAPDTKPAPPSTQATSKPSLPESQPAESKRPDDAPPVVEGEDG